MKKLSNVLFASLLLAPLAACGDDDGGGDAADTDAGTGSTGETVDPGTTSTTDASTGTPQTSETESAGDSSTGGGGSSDSSTGAGESSGGSSGSTGGETEGETEGDPEAPAVCAPSCEEESDCFFGGTDVGYECEDSLCVPPPPPEPEACTEDVECADGTWAPSCETNDDCAVQNAVCVPVGDGAACAPVPADGACAAGQLIFTVTDIEENEGVEVCGLATLSCQGEEGSMACAPRPCTDEDAPACPGTQTCDEDTGVCIDACTDDTECPEGLPVCDTDAGQCVICLEDADCAENEAGGTCYENSCITVCEDPETDCENAQPLDGETFVCN